MVDFSLWDIVRNLLLAARWTVLLSLIGAFYYLRIIKVMWFDAPTGGYGAGTLTRSRGVTAVFST